MTWTIAKKELRGYFNTPVAIAFLAGFLAFALGTFFWAEKFFARGIADLRPLFVWMPKLLIVPVAGIAMRLWSEEKRAGTLEVLLTLPIPRWKLVLGKFTAGMLLMAIALALTLGIPITVAMMGKLDWGPVFGGYFAAMLLSGAYLAIGMFVSATTKNPFLALIVTVGLCVILAFGGDLGTSAHFDSVARGVLDLRDLAYYGAIVGFWLTMNVVALDVVSWGRGSTGRMRRTRMMITLLLVFVNANLLNVWAGQIRRARIDLTQDGAYSLSSATKRIVGNLDEPLLIRGYFSEKTHPKLAPLVPQVRDLLDEYRVAGDGRVRVEIVDPSESDDAKREAKERFDISPTPVEFATANETSVVDAYFTIAIAYGDQHVVLPLKDLIQVRAMDNDVEITLRNPEYQITKSIKKAMSNFKSVDSLFASMPGVVEMTAYVTSKQLPETWKDGPAKLQKIADDLKKDSGGKLAYKTVEVATKEEMRQVFQSTGIQPFQDIFSGKIYFFHIVIDVGGSKQLVVPPEQITDTNLKTAVIDGLKRAAPGFTRVVGIWSPPAGMPMQLGEGMPPQQMPPPQTFNSIRERLRGDYEVRDVALTNRIPDDIETLVLGGPANLTERDAENIDQFVMRGGSLVVLAGRYRLAPANGIAVEKVTTGLEGLFKKWGITVGDEMVLDSKSDALPLPQNRDLGNGMMIREIKKLPYPYFVKIDSSQLSSSVITGGLVGSVMHWAAPVSAEAKVGEDEHKVEVLMTTSESSWMSSSTQVEPNLKLYPDTSGFPGPTEGNTKGAQVVALTVTGGFASGATKPAAPKEPPKDGSASPRLLDHSPPDTRIVVFGSSAFASDDILGLAEQLKSQLALANAELVHNAVDWAMSDTDLLDIRVRTAGSHALVVDSPATWRTINLIIAFFALAGVVGFAYLRRRAVQPVIETEA